MGHRFQSSGAAVFSMLAMLSLACGRSKSDGPEPTSTASPAPSSAAPGAGSSSTKNPETPARNYMPRGSSRLLDPPLQILPGAGLSAIRFGATFATVERLMGVPCDIRTESRCVYVDRALDLHFEAGALARIRVERRDRSVPGVAGKPRYFGLFNGAMRPSLMIGLHKHIVAEEYPEKPLKTEPLAGPDGQMEKQYFPGVALEFDRLENGNIVLSAFELTKDEVAAKKTLEELAKPAKK